MSQITIANVTPSTRDLQQFLSPNSGDTNEMILIESEKLSQITDDQIQKWEDDEVSGIVISVFNLENQKQDLNVFIKKACQITEAPFVFDLSQPVTKDILPLIRFAGGDAFLLDSESLNLEEILALKTIAQTMNLRIIPKVKTQLELNKLNGNFRIVHLANSDLLFDLPKDVQALGKTGSKTPCKAYVKSV